MSYQDPRAAQASYLRQPLYAQPPSYSDGYEPSAPPAPSPVPVHSSASAEGKFTASGYRDGLWAILFLVHLVAYLGLGGFVLHKYAGELTMSTNSTSVSSTSSMDLTPSFIIHPRLYSSPFAGGTANSTSTSADSHIRLQRDTLLLGLSSLAISAAVALLWLSLTKAYARAMIYAALISDILVSVVMVLVCLMYGAVVGVVLFALFAGLKALWVYWMRSRIELAALILTQAVRCLQLWPAIMAAAFLSIVVQSLWTVGWSFSTVGFYYAVTRDSDSTAVSNGAVSNGGGSPGQSDSSLSNVVVFLTLVSFYWVSQVIKNTLHVTVAGVAAVWYFVYPAGDVANPTLRSMKRALTTSFGSICLGSLILSVVRAMRVMVSLVRNQPRDGRGGGAALRAVCLCLVECLLSILDRVVEYVNKYAFAQCAIYGKSYCEAAQATWELFKVRGFDVLINDSVIGISLGFACLMAGLTSAAACAILSHVFFTQSAEWWVWALIGFVFGFAMTMIATEVIESSVATLFVCLAEAPDVLQRTKPDEYAKLVPVLQTSYPAVNFAAF